MVVLGHSSITNRHITANLVNNSFSATPGTSTKDWKAWRYHPMVWKLQV